MATVIHRDLSAAESHDYKPGGTDVPVVDGGTGASDAATALSNLGLTATAAELNYVDGVTSAIQTQLGAKLPLAGGTMAGNIVMGDGITIGQAAGPLVAFDDTNNYLEITGCNVGIGTTDPTTQLHITGNLTVGGGQIAFPATQAASANVNTLDDYEEGDWTGGFLCGTSGTITIHPEANTGTYVKIGRMVTVIGYFSVASVSSPVGELTLTGLPFVSGAGIKFMSAVSVRANALQSTGTTTIVGYIAGNTAVIVLQHFTAGNSTAMAADVIADSTFVINATYFID